MERLTEWNGRQTRYAYYPRCFEEPCYGRGCKIKDCPFETAVCERLAAYEDTGLMPEEVLPKDKADEIALKLMRLADLESLCNYTRLRELAEAERDALREEQRWIPVTERMPNTIPCNAGTEYSEAVIVWTTGNKAMIAVWDGIDLICPIDFWEAWGEEITHWMPLPEAAEEGEKA